MNWNLLGWQVPEERLALIVAALAASFTGWQAWSGHVTARVARSSERRKRPILELHRGMDTPTQRWQSATILVRAIDTSHGVKIKNLHVRRGRLLHVVTQSSYVDKDNFLEPPILREDLNLSRSVGVNVILGLPGSKGPGGYSADISRISILHIGIKSASDIKMEIEWMDGKKG